MSLYLDRPEEQSLDYIRTRSSGYINAVRSIDPDDTNTNGKAFLSSYPPFTADGVKS